MWNIFNNNHTEKLIKYEHINDIWVAHPGEETDHSQHSRSTWLTPLPHEISWMYSSNFSPFLYSFITYISISKPIFISPLYFHYQPLGAFSEIFSYSFLCKTVIPQIVYLCNVMYIYVFIERVHKAYFLNSMQGYKWLKTFQLKVKSEF